MTKPDGIPPDPNHDAWGTWEELLLAFAVNRHGTAAWDSIASELQKRTSHPNLFLTPQYCRSKYLDLNRRFVASNDHLDDDKPDLQVSAPLLDELRKLRVAELRREVQRYDLNIESLELKMKTMEEERERSPRREKTETDLKAEKTETESEPATGEEMEKDQLSVNESNSTDPGMEKLRSGEKESEPVRIAGEKAERDTTDHTGEEPSELRPDMDQKLVREDSCNGSSNSIQEPNRKPKVETVSESANLVESEPDDDDDALKENSDVQSSASRSRKEEGSDKVRRMSDDREHEDQSLAAKDLPTESQSLIDFLRLIRSRKIGSVFERRLRSQESSNYRKLVLQHMDLETVETRLKEGWSSGCFISFLRDLLLLVNNALVFFPKHSGEANAATEIRSLISKEIFHSLKLTVRSESLSGKQIAFPKKEEAEPPNSSVLKPRMSDSSLPLIVCRKRSSIAAKASASSSDKKKDQTPLLEDPKLSPEEPKITKKRTRDRFSSVSANAKKNVKNSTSNNSNKNSAVESSGKQGKEGGSSSSQHTETKGENKKNQSSLDSKKRGAANFLNRMKQGGSSSSNKGVLLDALKNTPLTSESTSTAKGASELKKNNNAKKKEQAGGSRRSTDTRQVKEKVSPGKRNVGRPPKREVAPSPALGKRYREKVEMETPPSKQPKKRSRKL